MELDMLHSLDGDKKKELDTTTAECRIEVEKFFNRQIKDGVALFLERGKKTYRITGYDAKKDKLKVKVQKREVLASPDKGAKTAVPPRAGG